MVKLFSEDISGLHKLEDIESFYSFNICPSTRTIYIGSAISAYGIEHDLNADIAEHVLKALHILSESSNDDINIILNSPGGDVYHALAIYDAISTCSSYITITAYGYCMSAGSLIFQAADKRIMAPNAWMMIHEGSRIVHDTHSNVQAVADHDKHLLESMVKIYTKQSNLDSTTVKDLLKIDTYLNAYDAVKHGLADSVLGEDDE